MRVASFYAASRDGNRVRSAITVCLVGTRARSLKPDCPFYSSGCRAAGKLTGWALCNELMCATCFGLRLTNYAVGLTLLCLFI